MILEKMDDFVVEHRDEYLDQLFNLLNIKSISIDRDEIRNYTNVLKSEIEVLGTNIYIMEMGGNSIVYDKFLNNNNRFTLLIYEHYDVYYLFRRSLI